jgi:hypothetical protein
LKKFCYTISGLLSVLLLVVLGFKYLGINVDKKVESAFNKLSNIENFSLQTYMEIVSVAEDQTQTLKTDIRVDQFNSQKIMMTTTISMFGMNLENIKTYYEKVGNTMYVYQQDFFSDSTAYSKTVLDDEEPVSIEAITDIKSTLSNFRRVGTETIDGKKYAKIKAIASEELLINDSLKDLLESTGGNELDSTLLDKIKVYVYIDLEKEEFRRIEIDFIDYMKEYAKIHEEEFTDGEITKYIMYFDISHVGLVNDFNFPEVTQTDDSNDIENNIKLEDFKFEFNFDIPDTNT